MRTIETIYTSFGCDNIMISKEGNRLRYSDKPGLIYEYELVIPNRVYCRLIEASNGVEAPVKDGSLNKDFFVEKLKEANLNQAERAKFDPSCFGRRSWKSLYRFYKDSVVRQEMQGWQKYYVLHFLLCKERPTLFLSILEQEVQRIKDGSQKYHAWVLENGGKKIEKVEDGEIFEHLIFANGFDPELNKSKQKLKEYNLTSFNESSQNKKHVLALLELINILK